LDLRRYANRNLLPLSLRNRFIELQVTEFTQEELSDIIARRHDKLPPSLQSKYASTLLAPAVAASIAAVYCALNAVQMVKPLLTMREVVKWIRRFNLMKLGQTGTPLPSLWVTAGWSLLSPRVEKERHKELGDALCRAFLSAGKSLSVDIAQPITLEGLQVRFKQGDATLSLPVGDGPGQVRLDRSPLFVVQRGVLVKSPPKSFQRTLVQVVFATHACEPVLLLGPTCYKSLLVETWCRIFGRTDSLLRVHLTPETESPDLIGQMHPYSLRTALLEIVGVGRRLLHRVAAVRSTYRYHASRAALDLETLLKDALDGAQVAIERGLGVVEEGLGANDEARDEAGSAVTAANTCVVAIDGVPFIRCRL
jgi:hypothetical protein